MSIASRLNGRKSLAVVAVSAVLLAATPFGPALADHAFDHYDFDNDHVNQGYIQPHSTPQVAPESGSFQDRGTRSGCPIGVGTLLGAALGGLVGAQFGSGTGNAIATGAGVLVGGAVGNRADCQ